MIRYVTEESNWKFIVETLIETKKSSELNDETNDELPVHRSVSQLC